MSDSHFISISSQLEKLDEVYSFIEQLKVWANIDDIKGAGLTLAVSEAVTNAIKHGNKCDKNKKVNIYTSLNDSKLCIRVQDQGDGFDPADIPNPLAEENLLKTSGRGIFLMRQSCDDIAYSEKGNEVILTFHL